MKKYFTIIILLSYLMINAQNVISFKKSDFDLSNVISELFDAKFNTQTKEFIWKPNYAEKLEFGVSSDGYLYTKIDTILKYGVDKNIGTIVTNTYVKDENGKYQSCHACSPSLSLITFKLDEERENLELSYFKKFVSKFGSFGESASVSVLQISEEDYCIKVSNEWVGQGSSYSYEHLYYEGENILNIDSFGENPEEPNKFHYITTIGVDKINKIITLTKKETRISKKTKQKIMINNIEKYKFDDYNYRYIKICN